LKSLYIRILKSDIEEVAVSLVAFQEKERSISVIIAVAEIKLGLALFLVFFAFTTS
jgi:hypothetical protein